MYRLKSSKGVSNNQITTICRQGEDEDYDLSQADTPQFGWYQKGIFRYFKFSDDKRKSNQAAM